MAKAKKKKASKIITATTKRVLIISDLHCGHEHGLTHEDFDYLPSHNAAERRAKSAKARKVLRQFFYEQVKPLAPFDVVVANGDLIDGRGERAGGQDLIFIDRQDQVDCAIAILKDLNASKYVITSGTPYHSGTMEQWERDIAFAVSAEFSNHIFFPVNDLVFDCKHKVSRSSVPHSRHTSVAKERMLNVIDAADDRQPKSDVTIRSHIHLFNYCGGPGWLAMTTPSLQGATTYGEGQVSGSVDFGFLVFDVKSRMDYTWKASLCESSVLRPQLVHLW